MVQWTVWSDERLERKRRAPVLAEKIGRRERIRTSGPYVPNVVLYQAELLSEPVRRDTPSPREAPL